MVELHDRIAGRLATLRGHDVEIADLRRLTGGASRETWSFTADGERLILQRQRPGGVIDKRMGMEASLLHAAAAAGVPVPPLLDADAGSDVMGAPYLLSGFVEAETIARKILRDDEFVAARERFAAECGQALASLHAIPIDAVDGIAETDQLTQFTEIFDSFGDPVPTFDLAIRWLEEHRPAASDRTVVHGDFRLGNLMVDDTGLRAVVDWELAHIGDPMEDLGWLCVRAWRFGGPGPVGGMGSYDALFSAYSDASGRPVDPDVVQWWEVLGTLKWGIICIMQARSHLDGLVRSMELASIGRRVCENEHDLLLLLAPDALARATAAPAPASNVDVDSLHGRPTAAEIVVALREWVVDNVRPSAEGAVRFHSRVAENLLHTLERELTLGPAIDTAHERRLDALGIDSEREIADRLRDGRSDLGDTDTIDALAASVVDKVRVANPKWLVGDQTPIA